MNAIVLRIQDDSILVWDQDTSQRVLVHTPDAHTFCVGDHVRITYSGIMTMSIPPQITATCITKMNR